MNLYQHSMKHQAERPRLSRRAAQCHESNRRWDWIVLHAHQENKGFNEEQWSAKTFQLTKKKVLVSLFPSWNGLWCIVAFLQFRLQFTVQLFDWPMKTDQWSHSRVQADRHSWLFLGSKFILRSQPTTFCPRAWACDHIFFNTCTRLQIFQHWKNRFSKSELVRVSCLVFCYKAQWDCPLSHMKLHMILGDKRNLQMWCTVCVFTLVFELLRAAVRH